jgi:starvation-inducible DNA-binding protein
MPPGQNRIAVDVERRLDMTAERVRDTRVGIPSAARAKIVALLNARLADSIDYALSVKQAHWNIKGRQFIALHEMLDEFHSQAGDYADLIAERAVMLGGQARGTLQAAMEGTTLSAYPVEATSTPEHLSVLLERASKVGNAAREAIDVAVKEGDADTADLFTEVSRGLDKQIWYLEAHLAD